MENKNITVREWQKKFREGDFNNKSFDSMVEAGWYDWFCSTSSLFNRLKKLAPLIMAITDPNILDNYYVWFKNNCPMCDPLYDDVRFEPISGERDGRYFVVSYKDEREDGLWALYTERNGFSKPEMCFSHVRNAAKYLNANASSIWNKTQAPEPDYAAS